jgi:hypothetical protein
MFEDELHATSTIRIRSDFSICYSIRLSFKSFRLIRELENTNNQFFKDIFIVLFSIFTTMYNGNINTNKQ